MSAEQIYINKPFPVPERLIITADTTFQKRSLPAFNAVDPVSAGTHFAAFLICLPALPVLLIRNALRGGELVSLISLSVYMLTMLLLFGASSAYHTFNVTAEKRRRLRKLDHAMIYTMIAGSYTPICTMVLPQASGLRLLIIIWSAALIGVTVTLLYINCPKWIFSIIYILMGWAALGVMKELISLLSVPAFSLLLSGGILYTIGGIIYAFRFRLKGPLSRYVGSHEIFHIFVILGACCHYMMMINL